MSAEAELTTYTRRDFQRAPCFEQACILLDEISSSPCTRGPISINKPLVLYGAGELGLMSREYFDRIGIPISFVVDRDAERLSLSGVWEGIRLVTPDTVSLHDKQSSILAVCISTAPFVPIQTELLSRGWRHVVPVYDIVEAYRSRHPLSNGWFANDFTPTELHAITKIMSSWHDDVSRAHYLQFVAWRRLREEWHFHDASINTGNRYFIPEITDVLSEHERFVDVGAHHGGVIRKFLGAVKGRFDVIRAIEPDEANHRILQNSLANLADIDTTRITILQQAVSDRQGRRLFAHGLGYASQLSELGENYVDVSSLDELDATPTVLKLHIEGAEHAALSGSLSVLERYRPLIMATIYHNDLGIWELPSLVMENLPNYRFLLRLHGWVGTAAVLYGIPSERTTVPE